MLIILFVICWYKVYFCCTLRRTYICFTI